MMLPQPRAYIDWEVPIDKEGKQLVVCNDSESYNYYIDWLADYLFFTEIPIPKNQQELVSKFELEGGISSAVFLLSDSWGYSMFETELIEDSFLNGLTYEEYHQFELEWWNEMPQDEKELYDNPEEEFFTSEIEYNRIGNEALERKKVPENIVHADIAYRAIFATLLKKVKSKEERVRHLNYFYDNLDENSSK